MITIKDLFDECTNNDYSFMAHSLYYLLYEGKLSPDDPYTSIDYTAIDQRQVVDWMEKSYLCLNVTKVYCLKTSNHRFAFVYAKESQQAIDFLNQKVGLRPLNCHEYSLDFSIMRGNESITFREMKKDFLSFPALIGFYKKEAVYL